MEALPYYIQIGMSEEQYWNGPPYLTRIYRTAHINKQKETNYYLWLQGIYIHEAFSVVLQNAFRKKGSTPAKYSEKPYRITPMTKAEKDAQAEAERNKAIASLNAWKTAWDNKHG